MFPFINVFISVMLAVHAQQALPEAPASPPALTLKTIEIEWEDVPSAESYIVRLTSNQKGLEPLYFTTKEPRLVEQVPVGIYELRIRTKSSTDDVLSPWSDPAQLEVAVKELKPLSPPDKATLEARGKLTEPVEFSWTPVDKVKEYTITIWTEDLKDEPLKFTTRDTRKKLTVKTGRDYMWKVNFESATDIFYAQQPPVFTFTLLGPKLIKPSGFQTKVEDPGRLITWKATEDATVYKARLFFRFVDEPEYKPLKEFKLDQPQWKTGKISAGAYRVELIASAPNRVDSDAGSYEFIIKPSEAELLKR